MSAIFEGTASLPKRVDEVLVRRWISIHLVVDVEKSCAVVLGSTVAVGSKGNKTVR